MSITARGGYQIVDFHNIVVNEGAPPTIIPGIGEQIKNYLTKPVYISGLVIHTASMTVGYNVVVPPQYIAAVTTGLGDVLSFKITVDNDVFLNISIIPVQDAVMLEEVSD